MITNSYFQLQAGGEGVIEAKNVAQGLYPKEGRQENGKFGKSREEVVGGEEGEVWEEVSVKEDEDWDNSDPEIFNERLEALVDNMEPEDKEVRNKEAVLDSLRRVLRTRFPEVELTPYGSSQSSLAFSGSDLDVYVWLGDEEEVTNVISCFHS